MTIPDSFYSFDLTDYKDGQLQQIYFLGEQQLFVYQANNGFTQVATTPSIFMKGQSQLIKRGDFIVDLNNDHYADAIITDFTQTHLFFGQADGSMRSQSLPIKPKVNLFQNGASYSRQKVYLSDMNFDNKTDIVIVGEGELIVYLQKNDNDFSTTAVNIKLAADISGMPWYDKKDQSGNTLDQSDLVYRQLTEIRDINNDNIADLIVRFTQSSGVLDKVNDYEIYLGKQEQKNTVFASSPSNVVHTEGTLTGLEFVDIDSDKKLEVLLSGFDIGLSEIIGALLSSSIDQNVYIFKMDQNSAFPKKPQTHKTVELSFSLSSGQTGSSIVKLVDVNGDGLLDLVLSEENKVLKIYFAKAQNEQTTKRLFSKRAVKYKTLLPQEGANVLFDDINQDGKVDMVIRYNRLDKKSLAKRIKILLSSPK
ncbi:MAG: hypothetical protein COB35_05430 [Gammaproteobacteria bacterium]|nr:MAG: hypothetical protein COB35_05430 [Gammaproteobacteria bacterium]